MKQNMKNGTNVKRQGNILKRSSLKVQFMLRADSQKVKFSANGTNRTRWIGLSENRTYEMLGISRFALK